MHLLLIQPSIHSFSYPFIYCINVFIIYTKPHNTQLHKPSIYPSNKPIYVISSIHPIINPSIHISIHTFIQPFFHSYNHSPNQPFIHLFIQPSIQLPFYLLMFKPSIHLLHQCPPALGFWGSAGARPPHVDWLFKVELGQLWFQQLEPNLLSATVTDKPVLVLVCV